MTAVQLQLPAAVDGAVDAEAGERAKAAGMSRAAARAAPDWATACRAAITVMAARGLPFQASDLVREGLVDEPDHHSAWGAAFNSAARSGLIQDDGYGPSKRVTTKASACHIWIGTNTKDGGR